MEWRRILFWLFGIALWALLRGLLPLLPVPLSLFPLVWFWAVVVGVALVVWLAFEAGRVFEAKWAGILGLIAAGARVGLAFLPLSKSLAARVAVGAIADSLVLAAALFLGSSISGFIRHANLLLPIAIVLTVVDIWTVWLGGFFARVQQKAQEGVVIAQRVIEAATVRMPTVATAQYAHVSIPVIGIGDLFFAAFLFALLWKFGLNTRSAFVLSVVFVTVGLMLAQLPFIPFGVPGLPFIALAILLPNLKSFQYTPEEKKALLIGAIFLVGLLALFSLMVRQL
jgi:hypothetical protein